MPFWLPIGICVCYCWLGVGKGNGVVWEEKPKFLPGWFAPFGAGFGGSAEDINGPPGGGLGGPVPFPGATWLLCDCLSWSL